MLIATNEDPAKLIFVARKGWGARAQTIQPPGCRVAREPKFLSENLVIAPESGKGADFDLLLRARPRQRACSRSWSFSMPAELAEPVPETVPLPRESIAESRRI